MFLVSFFFNLLNYSIIIFGIVSAFYQIVKPNPNAYFGLT
ncbi:hypothetical protein GARC_3426 [Paraglaciecola arctica BSs20135]|uniref:Uncharacterized protein n=1 Tax=Paraglaciecola arctica BSs20135 TaxID=493475 RepID=K6XIB7_9ALTE|nr:hypothetical protein GARC_3426 [Paraglaciecola arctica BSs20135]